MKPETKTVETLPEAEKLMWDRDPQQKHALNEFNVFAFNNVPFLADRCEALMKANAVAEGREPPANFNTTDAP